MRSCYEGKRAFVTGHTGKVGVKLSKALADLGAKVTGFSLPSNEMGKIEKDVISMFGDVRDKDALSIALEATNPEIIYHLAKVDSNKSKLGIFEIFETNVMGTLNLLETSKNLENLSEITMLADTSTASKKAAMIAAKAYEPLLKEKGIKLSFVDDVLQFNVFRGETV